jgi:septum formation protein
MHQIILASESPRRRQLLSEAGFSFDVVSLKVSEIPDKNLNINAQILDIAERKAKAVFARLKSEKQGPFLVLAADTEVIYDESPMGKPSNADDAVRMLKLLSGISHDVKTAVVLMDSVTGKTLSRIETTKVYFKKLSEKEIRDYVATGEPMDKAGAYGIQGQGRALVEKFEGPFDNVVGLPIDTVKEMLSEFIK